VAVRVLGGHLRYRHLGTDHERSPVVTKRKTVAAQPKHEPMRPLHDLTALTRGEHPLTLRVAGSGVVNALGMITPNHILCVETDTPGPVELRFHTIPIIAETRQEKP
jgi:hypothetical protein